MSNLICAAGVLPMIGLICLVALPSRAANHFVSGLSRIVVGVAGANFVLAVTCLAITQIWGATYLTAQLFPAESVFGISFYFDGISTLMWTLVAFVGWVICRFSVRYLNGEEQQGRYFKWTGFTIGAVSIAVVSANLALMVLALLLTSVGLHQLLVHYGNRPAARRAAGLKFFFSRLGDVCLIVAATLLYREFGTLELPALFTAVSELSPFAVASSTALPAVGWLIVLCALFKSAQFPFHTWLPETMEAPTPVSALMHAGIVNAGGYILIRMSPIMVTAPSAMILLAGVGGFTAVLAALVMVSQSSVKRKLAWSTVAQMGFMMLQCGLGAWTAAMLHIVVHSLYKAHAFLSSGSVMQEHYAMAGSSKAGTGAVQRLGSFVMASGVTLGLFATLAAVFGFWQSSKPGAVALGFVMCLGLIHWMWQMFQKGRDLILPAALMCGALLTAYFASYSAVDFVVGNSPASMTPLFPLGYVTGAIALAFGMLFVVEAAGTSVSLCQRKWLEGLYLHSSNGFYIDVFWRRLANAVSF